MEGKQTRDPLTGERAKCEEVLHTIHSDICGPMATEGCMGERYFTTFIDERSGRIAISLLRHKSEVFERFREYQAKVERETGKRIKHLRSDGGGEYTGHGFRNYLVEKGITHRMTPPYTPEHNGIAERANRTITEMVRCMLFDARLGQEFWGYAALAAVHIINRLPSSAHKNQTPFEIWFGVLPSISHLRVFGCTTYRHIPAPTRRKLDRRATKCRLVGYAEDSGSSVYRVYDEEAKQVFTTRDVVFNEETKEHSTDSFRNAVLMEEEEIGRETTQNLPNQNTTTKGSLTGARRIAPFLEEEDDVSIGEPLPPIDPDERSSPINTFDEDTIVVSRPPRREKEIPEPGQESRPNLPENTTIRRSQRVHQRKEMFGLGAWPAFVAVVEEPVSLQEALQSENAVDWKAAWESELESLRKNETWVVEKVPTERNIVGCRWLFRRKEDGRFKVRLVAKGYSQEPGIDFKEMFAPVGKFTTLRVLLALVAENDWELHSMDVKTAFLNGELEEEIFMECPEGLHDITEPGYACRLVKAIYGLRQSPRAWYQKIHTFFTNHEFHRST